MERYPDIVASISHMHSTTSDTNSDKGHADPPRILLRSHASVYISHSHCIICCSGVENGELNRAMQFPMHEKQ